MAGFKNSDSNENDSNFLELNSKEKPDTENMSKLDKSNGNYGNNGDYDKDNLISISDIIEILRKISHITGATVKRRTQTIVSWFKWIRNNLGLVEVDNYGNISIAKQVKLN